TPFLEPGKVRQLPRTRREEEVAAGRRTGACQLVPPTKALRGFTVKQEHSELRVELLLRREPVEPTRQDLLALRGVVDDQKCLSLPREAVCREGFDHSAQVAGRQKARDPFPLAAGVAVDCLAQPYGEPGLAASRRSDQHVDRNVYLFIKPCPKLDEEILTADQRQLPG